MFYGVTLMLIVVIMLLVLDHKSLYTRFFRGYVSGRDHCVLFHDSAAFHLC